MIWNIVQSPISLHGQYDPMCSLPSLQAQHLFSKCDFKLLNMSLYQTHEKFLEIKVEKH